MPPQPISPATIPEPRHRLLSGAVMVALSALLFSSKAVMVKIAYPYGIDALGSGTLLVAQRKRPGIYGG